MFWPGRILSASVRSAAFMTFGCRRPGFGCLTLRREWDMAPLISASSCDGTILSIPFSCRDWVGCGTKLGLATGRVGIRYERERSRGIANGLLGSVGGAEVVARD